MAHGKDSGTSHENSDTRQAPNRHIKGDKKYKEMISRDNNGSGGRNLPFNFIKPPRAYQARRDIFHVCDFCFYVSCVNKNTSGKVCSGCSKYTRVNTDNSFSCEESLDSYLQVLQVK
jgi:hypothetical protein